MESAQGEIGQIHERFRFGAKRRGEFTGDLEPRYQNDCRSREYFRSLYELGFAVFVGL